MKNFFLFGTITALFASIFFANPHNIRSKVEESISQNLIQKTQIQEEVRGIRKIFDDLKIGLEEFREDINYSFYPNLEEGQRESFFRAARGDFIMDLKRTVPSEDKSKIKNISSMYVLKFLE